MPRAPLKVDELAIHRDPRAITDWNTLVEVDATTTIYLCADPDSRYAGRYFLPRQRQLEVWTQIGFGIVDEFIGLLGGEPMSTTDGVVALQRHRRQLGGRIAVPYFVAQFVAHLRTSGSSDAVVIRRDRPPYLTSTFDRVHPCGRIPTAAFSSAVPSV
jgi:hypothetical protein